MSERKCPLCGASPTRLLPLENQRCKLCELSCRHWPAIDDLKAANAKLQIELQNAKFALAALEAGMEGAAAREDKLRGESNTRGCKRA